MVFDSHGPIVVTLDIDWAPDWMIAAVAERLNRRGVRATFFATHPSSVLSELASDPRFEVGIHPNFLPGSSHGSSSDEVLTTMKEWYPAARICRTHSLVQSEPLLALMASRYGILADASIHLPRASFVTPHRLVLEEGGNEIVRVPHIFQDNMHAIAKLPWTPEGACLDRPGWKVLNFHPIHIVTNMSRIADYRRVKAKCEVARLRPEDVEGHSLQPPGTGAFFDFVLEALESQTTMSLSDHIALWKNKEVGVLA